eukprot:scaffold1122_cov377-Prasinococcus_capsulatus_cf.AAC.9
MDPREEPGPVVDAQLGLGCSTARCILLSRGCGTGGAGERSCDHRMGQLVQQHTGASDCGVWLGPATVRLLLSKGPAVDGREKRQHTLLRWVS